MLLKYRECSKRLLSFFLAFIMVFSMISANVSVFAAVTCHLYIPLTTSSSWISSSGKALNETYLSPNAKSYYSKTDPVRGGTFYWGDKVYVTPDENGYAQLHCHMGCQLASGNFDSTLAGCSAISFTTLVGTATATGSDEYITITNAQKGDIIKITRSFSSYSMSDYILIGDMADFNLIAFDSNGERITTSSSNRITLDVGETYKIYSYTYGGTALNFSDVQGSISNSSYASFDGETVTAIAGGKFSVQGKYSSPLGTAYSQSIYFEVLENSPPIISDVTVDNEAKTAIVTATDATDTELMYGYSTADDSSTVTNWQSSNTFSDLDFGTYYFFAKDTKDAISDSYSATLRNAAKEISVDGVQTEYVLGEEFIEQGTVKVTFIDDTEQEIDLTEDMITGFDTSVEGTVTITVTYDGVTTTFDIVVKPETPIIDNVYPSEDGLSLIVESASNGEYLYGYSTSDDITTVTNWQESNSFLPVEDGDYYFFMKSVNYEDIVSESYKYTASGLIYATGIELKGVTDIYDLDAPFDGKGTVVVTYTNGKTEDIPLTSDMLSGFDTSTEGEKEVTVTLDGQTATYDIIVADIKEVTIDVFVKDNDKWTLNKESTVTTTGEVDYVILPDGTKLYNKSEFNYIITENDNYTFTAISKDGVSKDSELVNITTIDNEAPLIIIGYNASVGKVVVNAIDNIGVDKVVMPDEVSYDASEIPVVFDISDVTVGTIRAYDLAGNLAAKDFTINNFVQTTDEKEYHTYVGVSGIPSTWINTNANVKISAYSQDVDINSIIVEESSTYSLSGRNSTITEGEDTDNTSVFNKSLDYVVEENGTYSYTVTNVFGTYEKTFTVEYIDKVAPTIRVNGAGRLLNIFVSDNLSGIQKIEYPDGNAVLIETDRIGVDEELTYVFDTSNLEPGEYEIVVYDYAGNRTFQKITVSENTVEDNGSEAETLHYVTFKGNTLEMDDVVVAVANGMSYIVLDAPMDIIPENMKFISWNTSADGTGTSYAPGDVLEYISSDITLYLIVTEKDVYTITLSAEDLGIEDIVANVEEGQTYTIPSMSVPGNIAFLGYSTTPDGEVEYEVDDVITPTEDMNLYAIYKLKYMVSIKGNNSGAADSETYVIEGENYTVPSVSVGRGKELVGYSTTATGEKEYSVGDVITVNDAITLYVLTKNVSTGGSGGGGGGGSNRPTNPPKQEEVYKPTGELTNGKDANGNNFELADGISTSEWVDKGYIKGYPNGEFGIGNYLTRAEFAVILYRVFDFKNEKITVNFTDVHADWYKEAVGVLASNGIILGIGNNKFDPEGTLTIEHALLMLGRIINLDRYIDVDSKVSRDRDTINAMIEAGVTSELPKGYNEDRPITRLEMVQFVNKIVYSNLNTNNKNPFTDVTTSTKGYRDIVKAAYVD